MCCFGSHNHSHKPLSLLEDEELLSALRLLRTLLENLLGKSIDSISFPYGSSSATSIDVVTSAAEAGYRIDFSMTRGLNTFRDVEKHPLSLKRRSVNELKE